MYELMNIRKLLAKAKAYAVESDGFLTSTGKLWSPKEWHSFGIGVIDGYMNPSEDYIGRLDKVRKENDDVDEEPHYFKLGYPIGMKLFVAVGLVALTIMSLIMFYFLKQP